MVYLCCSVTEYLSHTNSSFVLLIFPILIMSIKDFHRRGKVESFNLSDLSNIKKTLHTINTVCVCALLLITAA